jgi:hypothetical protein
MSTDRRRGSRESFRHWLVEKLSGTDYAFRHIPDASIDAVAHQLGVEPEVLLEARLVVLERRLARGRGVGAGRARRGSGHYQLQCVFVEPLWQLWQELCELRGLRGSQLLRSLVHAYLLGNWEPEQVSTQWVWRGRAYGAGGSARYRYAHPFRERALSPRGARRALVRRAARLGTTVQGLLRGVIVATLEGQWARAGSIPIIDARTMYDDEARYFLG